MTLSEWGTPRELVRAGGWVLERKIADTQHVDVMGCYPLMMCEDWSQLATDLDANEYGWVTMTAVVDPLSAPPEADLHRIFRDLVRPFKAHYIVDLDHWTGPTRKRHRAMLRAATTHVVTDVTPARPELLDEWSQLYEGLVARHTIRGLRAFSRRSFAALFAVPGVHIARAVAGGETVAMSLWATRGDSGYYHLSASSKRGYELAATYAMVDSGIRYLKGLGLRFLDLGGGAGVTASGVDGLADFKRGWATADRTAWLCGRVLDADACRALAGRSVTEYFPPYRAEELP